jgi:hypothetical protein
LNKTLALGEPEGCVVFGKREVRCAILIAGRSIANKLGKTGRLDSIYCLLEEDSLVSGLRVESERSLTEQKQSRR